MGGTYGIISHIGTFIFYSISFVNRIDIGIYKYSYNLSETINVQDTIDAQRYSKQSIIYIRYNIVYNIILVFYVTCFTGDGMEDLINFIKNLEGSVKYKPDLVTLCFSKVFQKKKKKKRKRKKNCYFPIYV